MTLGELLDNLPHNSEDREMKVVLINEWDDKQYVDIEGIELDYYMSGEVRIRFNSYGK